MMARASVIRKGFALGAVVAVAEALLWLLLELELSVPALVRSAEWGLVVWLVCGLTWILLHRDGSREDHLAALRRAVAGQPLIIALDHLPAERGLRQGLAQVLHDERRLTVAPHPDRAPNPPTELVL